MTNQMKNLYQEIVINLFFTGETKYYGLQNKFE